MEFRILGELEVEDRGRVVELGGARQRALLSSLLLHAGEVVSTDRLIEDLYGAHPPATAAKTLQAHVSRLRKALGPEQRLRTRGGGYVLELSEGELDVERFSRLFDEGRRSLAAGRAEHAVATLERALDLWRGRPLADVAYAEFAQGEIARLDELRLAAIEELIEGRLALGLHADAVGELESLVATHPLRERLRASLLLALYRSGRQGEALEAYQATRAILVEELGIEPTRPLRDLHQAILNQDPALDLPVSAEPNREEAGPTIAPLASDDTLVRDVRKTVTAVFVRLAIADEGGKPLDPEALRRVTGRAFEALEAAADRHGGTIETVSGDAITAVFGLPLVHEDDALRAVRAAADARTDLFELAVLLGAERALRLEFRIGISTGEVVTGGTAVAQARATGEPLTISSRLGDHASPGEILIDRATRRVLRDAVMAEPAVDGWRVLDVADVAPGRVSRFDSPMVGRQRERRRLQDAFDQAASDRSCQLFTVLGVAGVGKSRLVREFLADLDDNVVSVRGRCLPYGEGITYWPVLEAVMDISGIDDAESTAHARRRLAELLKGEENADRIALHMTDVLGLSGADAGVEESFPVIRRFFEAVAARRSLVVVFDDIHWGEAMFLDLVEHLADWSRGVPILLLCMARPELLDVRPSWGGGKLNATSVLLEPLSASDCAQLVANLVGEAELAEEVGARIAEASEGNPLFVEEMFSMLIDDGHLVQADGRWTAAGDLTTVPVPPTIHALLAARLDRLTGEERAVVERAAVEGKLFHNGSVKALTSALLAPAVDIHLGSLVRKELIRPVNPFFSGEDAYRFRHLLIRDAAYESIPKEVRAGLHELHADWLSTKTASVEYDEIVGYHLEQAFRYRAELGPIDEATRSLGRRAAERLGAAGRRAFVRSDATAGVNLISRSVALLPPDDPFRVELVPSLRVIQGLPDLSWADRVLTEAVEAAATSGDRGLAAHALVQRGFLRLFTGSEVTPSELFDVANRAIAVFGELGDELGLARAWRLVAQTHYLDRRAASSAEASEQALIHARRARDRFEEREIVRYLVVALLLGPAPAVEAFARCDELLAERWDDLLLPAEVSGAAAALLAMQGRAADADELIAAARTATEDAGESIWVITQWYSYVILYGDATSAEAELRPAYQALGRIGETGHFSTIAHALANAVYRQGRYDEAEQLIEECERASGPNDVHSQVLWRSTRAKVFARRHAFDEAERLAREAVEFAETSDFLPAHADALADLAEVLALMGRPDEAAHALDGAIEIYERKGNVLAANSCRARLAHVR
jgi:DNA-binding SARP family transcriptional activator